MIKYHIIRIEEPDFGCEGRIDGMPMMDKVYLVNGDKEICIEVEDKFLYERKMDEGTEVTIGEDGILRKIVSVVAAVIQADNKIFATQRGYGDMKDGWEFPGGKIESGETPKEALKREIMEELDTEIEVDDLIETVEYDYPTFHLSMQCFWCKVISGELVLKEHEAAKWLSCDELYSVDWLPADISLIETISKII